ncbi:hypothetical protein F5Y12DRAFT_775520 [Xylaria sp. FL1777]|nr:hypothetical protein F5Y12DRAFT_775520 [Xylaria sp. FL1777]
MSYTLGGKVARNKTIIVIAKSEFSIFLFTTYRYGIYYLDIKTETLFLFFDLCVILGCSILVHFVVYAC